MTCSPQQLYFEPK